MLAFQCRHKELVNRTDYEICQQPCLSSSEEGVNGQGIALRLLLRYLDRALLQAKKLAVQLRLPVRQLHRDPNRVRLPSRPQCHARKHGI